jgi:Flp pilus assembly protein TadG
VRASVQSQKLRGQASLELALLIPIGLILVFAVLGVARITTAAISLSAVVRESARAGAQANTAADAWQRAYSRGRLVASEGGLSSDNLDLVVDTSAFRPAGQVRATARYTVSLVDVPFLGLGQLQLSRGHAEPVGNYRGFGQ